MFVKGLGPMKLKIKEKILLVIFAGNISVTGKVLFFYTESNPVVNYFASIR